MRFCRDYKLILPSTFAAWHYGGTATMRGYTATHQGIRDDYIGVSCQLAGLCLSSWVEPGLDAGHSKIDHAAVITDIQWPAQKYTKHPSGVQYDRTKIATASPQVWDDFFADWPDISWSTDLTSHTKIIEDHLQIKLQAFFPKDPPHRRGTCMSTKTRDLYEQRRYLRKLLAETRVVTDRWLQKYAWDQWTSGRTTEARCGLLLSGLRAAWRWKRYHMMSRLLKENLRHDQEQWLNDRLHLLETSSAKEIHKILKPLRMGKRVRHLGYRQLPQVRLENGDLAATHDQATSRHLRGHVGRVEILHMDLATDDVPCTLDELPSVYELEFFMRQSKPNKGMGHDLVPGELLRCCTMQRLT